MTPATLPSSPRARALRASAEVVRDHLKPAPRLTVSEWADRFRILPETSAEPGPWRTDRTPYLRGIMDGVCQPEVERVSWRKPAQVGGSEAILNVLGYFMDQDPAPILLVQISDITAAKFSKERVAPLIADTPALARKISPAGVRDSDNTIESKVFPGGHLGIVGATAPSKLRSRPRRVLLFDEVDGYPASAGSEGDPIELARKRQTTYWNRVELAVSTPTLQDLSRIEDLEAEADELRRYHVPCPHCGELQVLTWERLVWDKSVEAGEKVHHPETARYECGECGEAIHEHHKARMLRDEEAGGRARWVADEPHAAPRRIAFHLNALYSPWLQWSELAREWIDAQGNPQKLQVFVNTRLAETWDETGQTVDETGLMARREDYPEEPLPEGVVLLTAGVDVQADRLEMEVVGWGPGEQSWSIDYLRLPGDPTGHAVWQLLDEVIQRAWSHPAGPRLRILATCVDSGYLTQQVQRYAKDRLAWRVWAVKGMDGFGRPIMDRPSRKTRRKVPLYPVGVDNAKRVLYAQLAIDDPGPGYCHFPARAPYDEEFFRQLTAEKVVRRQTRGNRLEPRWVRRPGRRAEVLDCRVYAMAAKEGLLAAGLRLDALGKELRGEPVPGRRRRGRISKGVEV